MTVRYGGMMPRVQDQFDHQVIQWQGDCDRTVIPWLSYRSPGKPLKQNSTGYNEGMDAFRSMMS